MKLRIIQWREFGDGDDTLSARLIKPGDEQSDHEFICASYKFDPELEFDQGGIAIISWFDIEDGVRGSDENGNKFIAKLFVPE